MKQALLFTLLSVILLTATSAMARNPALLWHTFHGGADTDGGIGIALDKSGNIYVVGTSGSSWGTPINPYAGFTDVFVAKLSWDGVLLWNTFLGGGDTDNGRAIAMDGNGNVYVAGDSWATWGSPITPFVSGVDSFVAKLDSNGSLQWHTFLGGNGFDYGNGIAADESGNVYVAGRSGGGWGSPKVPYAGNDDAYAAKLNTAGTLLWNTFLGGAEWDTANAVSLDSNGNICVSGYSEGTWGTSPKNGYAALSDVFAAMLNTDGTVQWNTFLGGAGNDYSDGIALDGSDNIYIVGESAVPWGAPVDPLTIGSIDAFAAKLDSSGERQWNTFMGGTGYDGAYGVTVDGSGNPYVAGFSAASWGSPVAPYTANEDGFIVKLDSDGMRRWNMFMGGQGYDAAETILFDSGGNLYVTGESNADWGMPVNGYTGDFDAFVAKFTVRKFPWTMYLPAIINNIRK